VTLEALALDMFHHFYRDEKLTEWVPRIRHLDEEALQVHVLFNTNREDQGPVNARMMAQLLD